MDITEIKGADSLFEATSVIKESEDNAGNLFGADTYYSTEGSSLCIRAMVYLVSLYAKKNCRIPLILAARNVHKTFVSAAALCNVDVEWLFGKDSSYLTCDIDADMLDKKLESMLEKPVAVYVTSPDYLGNILDVKAIAQVCHKHGVLLVVDNAHGAYLRFLNPSMHPVDLGADMCCDSAHKTLPVLTGGAYLHISKDADPLFSSKAKNAMALFASTSPSYLILQSLDFANKYMSDEFAKKLSDFVALVDKLKDELVSGGYKLMFNEPLKITIRSKDYGYIGYELADLLREQNIECEFCDPDFVVLMLTLQLKQDGVQAIRKALLGIPKRTPVTTSCPALTKPKKVMGIHDAVFSDSCTVSVRESEGKVLSAVTVSCPPAVPVLVCGEQIDKNAIEIFEYYGIDTCEIITEQ